MTQHPDPPPMPDEIYLRRDEKRGGYEGPVRYPYECAESYTRTATIHPCTERERVLAEENARLREALDFYAKVHDWPNDGPWGSGSTDFGQVARTTLAAEIVGSPATPTPTLESLLAKVPEGWRLNECNYHNNRGYWTVILWNNAKRDVVSATGETAALALSSALNKLNTQGEKA